MASILVESFSSPIIMKEYYDEKSKKDEKPNIFALVCEALGNGVTGISFSAIRKWIVGNYAEFDTASLDSEIKTSVTKGLENGIFKRAKHIKEALDENEYFKLTVNDTYFEDVEESDQENERLIQETPRHLQTSHLRKMKKLNKSASLSVTDTITNRRQSGYFYNQDRSLPLNIDISHVGLKNSGLNLRKTALLNHSGLLNIDMLKSKTQLSVGRRPKKTKPNSGKVEKVSNGAQDEIPDTGLHLTIGFGQDQIAQDAIASRMSLSISSKSQFKALRSSSVMNSDQKFESIANSTKMSREDEKTLYARSTTNKAKKNRKPAKEQISEIVKNNPSTKQVEISARQFLPDNKALETTMNKIGDDIPVLENAQTRSRKRAPLTKREAFEADKQVVKLTSTKRAATSKAEKPQPIKVKIPRKPSKTKYESGKGEYFNKDAGMTNLLDKMPSLQLEKKKVDEEEIEPVFSKELEHDKKDNKADSKEAPKFKLFKEHLEPPKQRGRPQSKKTNSSKTAKGKNTVEITDLLDKMPILQLAVKNGVDKEKPVLSKELEQEKKDDEADSKEVPTLELFKEHLEPPKQRGRPKGTKTGSSKTAKSKNTGLQWQYDASCGMMEIKRWNLSPVKQFCSEERRVPLLRSNQIPAFTPRGVQIKPGVFESTPLKHKGPWIMKLTVAKKPLLGRIEQCISKQLQTDVCEKPEKCKIAIGIECRATKETPTTAVLVQPSAEKSSKEITQNKRPLTNETTENNNATKKQKMKETSTSLTGLESKIVSNLENKVAIVKITRQGTRTKSKVEGNISEKADVKVAPKRKSTKEYALNKQPPTDETSESNAKKKQKLEVASKSLPGLESETVSNAETKMAVVKRTRPGTRTKSKVEGKATEKAKRELEESEKKPEVKKKQRVAKQPSSNSSKEKAKKTDSAKAGI